MGDPGTTTASGWPSSQTAITVPCCQYCGSLHNSVCPRVKAFEYHPSGLLKRVEFHEPAAEADSR